MSLKDIFTNDNKINEGNIIMFVATLMFVVIDIVALCFRQFNPALNVFFLGLVAEHLLFIFLMNKTENSKLDAKDILNSAQSIIEKKIDN